MNLCSCLLLELDWFLSVKYRSYPGLGPLWPPWPLPQPNPSTHSAEPRIPGKVPAKFWLPWITVQIPSRSLQRTEGEPHPHTPRPPRLFWSSVEENFHIQHSLSRSRPPCTLIFMTLSVTPQRRQSHAAPVFIYLLVFLQVVLGSLGLYCPQSTKTVPVKTAF